MPSSQELRVLFITSEVFPLCKTGGLGDVSAALPAALRSLLKPLANWKYALTTLERMRRYADELGFLSPDDDEAEVWRMFESQSDELQSGMLARYAQTGRGGFNVLEEAQRRLEMLRGVERRRH